MTEPRRRKRRVEAPTRKEAVEMLHALPREEGWAWAVVIVDQVGSSWYGEVVETEVGKSIELPR